MQIIAPTGTFTGQQGGASMAVVKCPHCGRALEIEIRAAGGAGSGYDPHKAALLSGRLGMQRKPDRVNYYSEAASIPRGALGVAQGVARDNWQEVSYTEPARTPTTQGDVLVPLAQAAITGTLAAVVVGTIGGLLAGRAGWSWKNVVLIAISCGSLTTAVTWWALLQDTRGLLRRVESYIGRDLDGDNVIGPVPAQPVTRVEVTEKRSGSPAGTVATGDSIQRHDLPATAEELRIIAAYVLKQGEPLSRSTLTRAGLTDGRARAILAALHKAGYCRMSASGPNDPNGPTVTAKGRAVLLAFLEGAQ